MSGYKLVALVVAAVVFLAGVGTVFALGFERSWGDEHRPIIYRSEVLRDLGNGDYLVKCITCAGDGKLTTGDRCPECQGSGRMTVRNPRFKD